MRLSRTVMLAAALVAGAWLLSEGNGDQTADALVVATAGQGAWDETFRLTANGDEASCAVTRHGSVSDGRSELVLEPHCMDILPAMAQAKFWQEEADGSVIFTENGVDPIVTFAVGDGVAFESIQPQAPLISLAAVE
ncbi:hypothetical protein EET67_12235 [Pseudaminobacter arsenicus]|uniref:Alkaline proteinase inhibitor/ Outer membrane lipoprotein Omp19 domain-containing protein n=1 Tax=Borborobacter arsenicus TaxID=1851146 RepID=A0A432V5I7_9HYPH|nr:hypothetical protein [Pseudaminobacter arsenicus]RUM97424.1 hypothetical protein EET67_12235 [Pseudaminobacter arsenicus]